MSFRATSEGGADLLHADGGHFTFLEVRCLKRLGGMRRLPPGGRVAYRGTSLIRNRTYLRPYRRPIPRDHRCSWGGGRFL